MQEMLDAINRLKAAVDEMEKRNAAIDLGIAIGNALGTGSNIWRSSSQISVMTIPEIDTWVSQVESMIASIGPG